MLFCYNNFLFSCVVAYYKRFICEVPWSCLFLAFMYCQTFILLSCVRFILSCHWFSWTGRSLLWTSRFCTKVLSWGPLSCVFGITFVSCFCPWFRLVFQGVYFCFVTVLWVLCLVTHVVLFVKLSMVSSRCLYASIVLCSFVCLFSVLWPVGCCIIKTAVRSNLVSVLCVAYDFGYRVIWAQFVMLLCCLH